MAKQPLTDLAPLAKRRRLAGNRTYSPIFLDVSGQTGSNSWTGHYAPEFSGVRDLEIFYANFSGAKPPADGAAPITIKAALEYPLGTYIPLWTHTGSRSLVLEPGAIAGFRAAPMAVPAGAYYRVHTQVLGAAWSEGRTVYVANSGEGVQRGVGTDRTLSLAGMTQSAANSVGGMVPCAIVGEHMNPTGAVEIHGDSIAAGLFSASAPYAGFPMIALDKHLPWTSLAIESLALAHYGVMPGIATGSYHRQMAIATTGSTVALMCLGRNDVSRTVIQIETAMLALWFDRAAHGKRVFQTTITTQGVSSDGGATQAGMSPAVNDGPGGTRTQVNDWIRAGAPIQSGAPVAIGTVGATKMGNPGHPLTGYFETADVTETARNSGIPLLSRTDPTDGLWVHPNTAGQIALAAAIDWRRFL